MDDAPDGTPHARIDAAELSWVEVADDGRRLYLRVQDEAGRPASVSLPVNCLNAVLMAIPRSAENLLQDGHDAIHPLDSWTLTCTEQGLVLTLHLPDGAKIAFAVKPWQIVAMASLAGHGIAPSRGRLN